jgi:hypothetical protein
VEYRDERGIGERNRMADLAVELACSAFAKKNL